MSMHAYSRAFPPSRTVTLVNFLRKRYPLLWKIPNASNQGLPLCWLTYKTKFSNFQISSSKFSTCINRLNSSITIHDKTKSWIYVWQNTKGISQIISFSWKGHNKNLHSQTIDQNMTKPAGVVKYQKKTIIWSKALYKTFTLKLNWNCLTGKLIEQ